ncbi:hypothetical protein F5I97DRAFT_1233504 [Phlebopus sp. FC_14]|nr:hypothetical protein F5I97DRAFT_1233504 [Phlebopus sp. FC_14]
MLSLSSSSSSSRVALRSPQLFVRSYAVSILPPLVYEGKPVPRRYGQRKTFLFNQYTRMLGAGRESPMIFLQHKEFTARRLQNVRREIDLASSKVSPTSTAASSPMASPRLTIMKTSLFGVALRNFAPLDAEAISQIAKLVEGGFAVLSLPSLHPPQLNAVIRAIDRAVPPKKAATEQEVAKGDKGKGKEDEDFIPGRASPRIRPVLMPELRVVGALIEGRVFSAAQVKDVASLPPLDTLRAQIVGLLSSPATQLAAVLSEASGGRLARTLEGLKKAMEEGQQGVDASPS